MKLFRKLSFIIMGLTGLTATSCDFLDIVPPEQATLTDATKSASNTLDFLYSCYSGVWNPLTANTTDEHAFPAGWGGAHRSVSYGLYTPANVVDDGRWSTFFKSINQTHLFLRELETAREVSESQKEQWRAEAYFLLAYYHYELLQYYGPIPVIDKYYDTNTPSSEFKGRMHFDYVTDWIVSTLDEKVINNIYLPSTRPADERGRATSVIAKALKSRVLVYAASPLWNGSFPYPNWRNTEETPGYGNDLVSTQYNPEKWNRARVASEEAIQAAVEGGHTLYDDVNYPIVTQRITDAQLPFIPGMEQNTADNKLFKQRVLMLRNMMTLKVREGNTELIWGVAKDAGEMAQIMPRSLLLLTNGSYYHGQNAISPTLYSVEHFYTKDGVIPEHGIADNTFPEKSEWYKRAGINGRTDLTKINVAREPRYYAWMAFDQGDYGTMIAAGKPKRLEMKLAAEQGYASSSAGSQNYSTTGFLSQKWIRVDQSLSMNNTWSNNDVNRYARPIIRMAELYLNLAESQAALNNNDALTTLNNIRQRAGVRALTSADLGLMTLMDWVRNERFVELWGEGHRWNDVRRWVMGDQYFGEGKREGLNAVINNPSFDQFNTRIRIAQAYKWYNRMYMAPIQYSEVQKNNKLVQSPGY